MTSVGEARAIPDRGLEGDRYFNKVGTFSPGWSPDRAITLIEIESVDALKRDYGVELAPADSRRNVVTQGIALSHLVGREFKVGDVLLQGTKLCEPCGHLARLTHERVKPGLVHRGGLCARILSEGMIRVGDSVEALAGDAEVMTQST